MDSDAEGVPSEFFDYFKVLEKKKKKKKKKHFWVFFFVSLQISLSNFLGLYFTYGLCLSNSGFMHSRFSYLS